MVGPMQQIWSAADRALRTATCLVFVGYSLPETDLSVRYLLANSLTANPNLGSIIVKDPSPDTLARYSTLIAEPFKRQKKLQELPSPFPDGGIPQWP